jgi:hypothetical protein
MTDIVTDALEVIAMGGLGAKSDDESLDSGSRDGKIGGGIFEDSDASSDDDGNAATLKRVRTRVEPTKSEDETLELGTLVLDDDHDGYTVGAPVSSSETRDDEYSSDSSIVMASSSDVRGDEERETSTLKAGQFQTASSARREDISESEREAEILIPAKKASKRQKRPSTSDDSDSIDDRIYSEDEEEKVDEKDEEPEQTTSPVSDAGHQIVYQRSTEKKRPSRIELDHRVLAIPTSTEPVVVATAIRRDPSNGARKHSLSTVDDLKQRNTPALRKASLESTLSVCVDF